VQEFVRHVRMLRSPMKRRLTFDIGKVSIGIGGNQHLNSIPATSLDCIVQCRAAVLVLRIGIGTCFQQCSHDRNTGLEPVFVVDRDREVEWRLLVRAGCKVDGRRGARACNQEHSDLDQLGSNRVVDGSKAYRDTKPQTAQVRQK